MILSRQIFYSSIIFKTQYVNTQMPNVDSLMERMLTSAITALCKLNEFKYKNNISSPSSSGRNILQTREED